MISRFVKIAAWLLGGTIAVAFTAYMILLLANLEDQPPAAEIETITSLFGNLPHVENSENAHLFMLGFGGPPQADPMALGLKRNEWLKQAAPEFHLEEDPLGVDYDYLGKRREAFVTIADTCSESDIDCLHLLESESDSVMRWSTDERWLLERYGELLSYGQFRETVPFELLAPLPSYDLMFDAQRLHILNAWHLAGESNAAAVQVALNRDLVYWRMVLENSDTLITKMIATAAIDKHFKLGNLALRRLPQRLKPEGIPPSWRAPISRNERSMRRSLAGEWVFFETITRRVIEGEENPFVEEANWAGATKPSIWERTKWLVLKPFYQPQDVTNRQAKLMLQLAEVFDIPFNQIPDVTDIADDLQTSAYQPLSRLYNITGDYFMGQQTWPLSSYAVRVSDLEGVRRAALLTANMRGVGVSNADASTYISANEIVDPYTDGSFEWQEEIQSIIFYGLEPNERATHKFIY
ncbi:MAG: hypothetical protein AAAFM81_15305 [Pseudomonadota bacterium]